MAMKYLGATLDIHTGGEDNKFPHHECEIAQSEGATRKPFARLWLHAKHLLVEGKKMSKSLQNFYTLRDLVAKGYRPREIRYALISSHYRETLNFTLEGLKGAGAALQRVDELVDRLHNSPPPPLNLRGGVRSISPLRVRGERGVTKLITKARRAFIAALDDDLNVPEALAALFRFTRSVNRTLTAYRLPPTAPDRRLILKLLQEFDMVLGLGIGGKKKTTLPVAVIKLAEEREAARQAKNWKRADELRAQIREKGYRVDDTPHGPKLKAQFSNNQ